MMIERRIGLAALAVPAVLAALAIFASGCGTPPRAGVEEKFNLWPVARYETRTDPEGHTLDVLWPLVQDWRDGDASGSRVLPLWWDETRADRSRFTDVLLLYWQKHSEDFAAIERGLFPLVWWERSPSADLSVFFPLYGQRTAKDDGGKSWGFAVWPLVSWTSSGSRPDRCFGVVDLGIVSLFGRSLVTQTPKLTEPPVPDEPPGSEPASEPASAPALANHTEVSDTHFLSLFDPRIALFSQRESVETTTGKRSSHRHFFPLVWDSRDEDHTFSMFLPFHLGWAHADGSSRDFWVPPLFGREHDPARGEVGTDVLWPLIRSETWAEPGGDAWHFRFLPFAWFTKRPTSDVTLVLPFWYHLRDPANEYFHFVPFYGRHREDHDRRNVTFVVPPLFVRTTDKIGHLDRNEFLWPITAFEHSDDGAHSRAFPLWWWRSTPHTAHLNVLGIFDREESEITTRWLLWPLYSSVHKEGVGRRSAVLPVFDVVRQGEDPSGEEDSTSVLWPLSSFERRGVETARWVFPFYWWFDDGVNESHRHVWPLVGLDEEGSLRRWSFLWPFFWSGSTPDASRGDRHFLWPLGASEWNDQEVSHRFFPLWLHDRYPKTGHAETWVLWPTTYIRHDDEGLAEWSFLWEVLRYERTKTASEFHVMYALYRSHDEGVKSGWSVPLIASFEKDGGKKTLKLFLIPITWGDSGGESER